MTLQRDIEMREPDVITEWLGDVVRRRQRTVWTGRGASFALAQVLASVLQALNAPAYAVPASDIYNPIDALLCVISRSGVTPAAPRIDVMVAEEGSRSSSAVGRYLLLPNPDGTRRPWLPLVYLLNAAEIFVAAIKRAGLIPYAESPAYPFQSLWESQTPAPKTHLTGRLLDPQRQCIIIVGRHATPLQTLIAAAGDKLGQMPFRAMDLEEVGHGFHARLCLSPEAFEVLLVRDPDDCRAHWARLQEWCHLRGVACRLETRTSHHPALATLEAFAGVLSLLQRWCSEVGISPEECPIPMMFDSLRSLPGDNAILEAR